MFVVCVVSICSVFPCLTTHTLIFVDRILCWMFLNIDLLGKMQYVFVGEFLSWFFSFYLFYYYYFFFFYYYYYYYCVFFLGGYVFFVCV